MCFNPHVIFSSKYKMYFRMYGQIKAGVLDAVDRCTYVFIKKPTSLMRAYSEAFLDLPR